MVLSSYNNSTDTSWKCEGFIIHTVEPLATTQLGSVYREKQVQLYRICSQRQKVKMS